jgi:cell division septum initiation protein DivIVA
VDAFKFEVESRRSRAAQELEDARATFRRENEELNQELDRAQAEVSGAAEKGRMMRQQALQLRSKVDNLQMQVRGGMCDPCGRCNERCVLPVCQCIKQRVCEVAEAARWAGEACSGMLLQVGHLEASVLQFSNPTLIKQNVLPPAPSPLLILSIPHPPPPQASSISVNTALLEELRSRELETSQKLEARRAEEARGSEEANSSRLRGEVEALARRVAALRQERDR